MEKTEIHIWAYPTKTTVPLWKTKN